MARELRVEFKGDASDLVRASDQAERSLSGMGSKMGGMLGGFGGLATAVGGVGVALGGAAVLAYDFAQAAAEDEQSAAALANVLKKTAGATNAQVAAAEDWISTTSQSVAIADDELRPALQRLAGATGDTEGAQTLLAAALDIAAGTGKPLASVVEALTKAQLGNVAGLGRLGVAVEDAQGRQLSLGTILDQSKEKFGGLAEAAANTSAGGMKKATIAMDEMKEQIGGFLLPILGRAAAFFSETVLPAIQQLIDYVQANWPRILAAVQPVIDSVVATVRDAADFIMVIFRGPIGQFLVNSVRTTFETIINLIEPALRIIRGIFATFAGLFTGDWSRMWDGIKAILSGIWDAVVAILRGTWDRVADTFSALADLITAPFRAAFNAIANFWNRTVGQLSFKIPDWVPLIGSRGWEVPDIPTFGGRAAAAAPAAVVLNMPVGTDPYSTVAALQTYGIRVAPVETAAAGALR